MQENPYSLLIYALKAPETKRKYVGHLITFFDFVDSSTERQPNVRRRKTTEELKNLQLKAHIFVERAGTLREFSSGDMQSFLWRIKWENRS